MGLGASEPLLSPNQYEHQNHQRTPQKNLSPKRKKTEKNSLFVPPKNKPKKLREVFEQKNQFYEKCRSERNHRSLLPYCPHMSPKMRRRQSLALGKCYTEECK